jgi:ribosomal protein S18 acetylase RimI-like enzyme
MTVIRPARSSDAVALATLAREAYSGYTGRIGREPEPLATDYGVAIATRMVWVVEDRDVVVGMMVLEDAGDHLLLENVAVLPRAQGRGVGSRLLGVAEAIAAERGLSPIRLYTNEVMTENIAYYQRRGYIETHRGEQGGYRRVFFAKGIPPSRRPPA